MRVTARYVDRYAILRQESVAVLQGSQTITYGMMASQLRKVAVAIEVLQLPPGGMIVVYHSDPYKHLLLVLGLEYCGLIAVQTRHGERADASFLADALLVIGDEKDPECPTERFLRIDQQWWQSAMTRSNKSIPVWHPKPEDQMLLFRSSGTTGMPKRIVVTRDMVRARIRHRARILRLRRTSRYLTSMPLSVAGSYYSVVACLRLGATVVLPTGLPTWQDVTDKGVTHLTVLPLHLQRLLDALPSQAPHQPELTVCIIGARLPDVQREAALRRWCGEIVSVYSSIEAGTIATIQPGGLGNIITDVRLRITGHDGQTLASGEIGQVCVSGPGVAKGYMSAPDGPSRFSKGWYFTGDLGCLHQDGRLELFGRHDDIVNLSGIKRSCDYVEEIIRAKAGLREVAVFTHDDRKLGQVLVVCVVPVQPVDAMRTAEICRMQSGCPVSLWFLESLPRTEHGKLRRGELRSMFQERLQAGSELC